MAARRALIAGASGLVGRACLDTLLAHPAYERVTAFGRRTVGRRAPRLAERIVAFDRLAADPVEPADDAFCALGTTIKTAGSQDAFRRVDLEMVAAFAAFARRSGAVDVRAGVVGRRRRGIRQLLPAREGRSRTGGPVAGVRRPCTSSGRASCYGDRTERRPGEAIGQRVFPWLSGLLVGSLRKYRGNRRDDGRRRDGGNGPCGATGTTVLGYDEIEAAAATAH